MHVMVVRVSECAWRRMPVATRAVGNARAEPSREHAAPQQCFVLMRLYGSLIGMIEWGEDIIIDTHELGEQRATEGAV